MLQWKTVNILFKVMIWSYKKYCFLLVVSHGYCSSISCLLYNQLSSWSSDVGAIFLLEVKGIISQDWEGLQMILWQRQEVFNFSYKVCFRFCQRFHYKILKMAALLVLHFNITHQMTSIVPETQTVLRNRATPGICSFASNCQGFQLFPDSSCSWSQ